MVWRNEWRWWIFPPAEQLRIFCTEWECSRYQGQRITGIFHQCQWQPLPYFSFWPQHFLRIENDLQGRHICRPSACQKSHILLRGRPLVQGVPSPKTVHRTVFEFTPCGAFSGYMWGFAPHPTRAVSPWPDQRDVIPLETQCLSFRLDPNFFDRLRRTFSICAPVYVLDVKKHEVVQDF